jgi:aerotolerance regulator-like protein/VWA domain-containing protein
MSFLYPAFLIGALAVALPIILHFLRRDVAPEVPFTAVRLLRRSPVERSRRRRLRDLLLLAARVAALILLATAFARPYLRASAGGGTLVVAVDRSYSMSAPGRFERAREAARAAIGEASLGQRVALVAFDDRAEVVAGAGSASDASPALNALKPGFGATRYSPVVQKAVELAEGTAGTLAIVTDLQRTGWADQSQTELPANWRMRLIDVGGPVPNLAIINLRVEPDRVVVSISNSGDAARRGQIRLAHDDRQVATGQFAVDPGATVEVPVLLKVPPKGGVSASLDDPGGIAADDVRYASLGTTQSSVLIVTGGGLRQSGFYLERALETSVEEMDGLSASVSAGASLASLTLDQLNAHSAVALLSTRGLPRPARDAIAAFTRGGGGLLLAAAPDLEPSVVSTMFDWNPPLTVGEHDGPLSLAVTDLRHPIFQPFGTLSANLGRVRFERGWRIRPDGWEVVARFSDGMPALLERREGNGRVVLFASDMDRRWNDFPLHPAFVPFTIESIRYAAGARQVPREFTAGAAPPEAAGRPGLYPLGPAKRIVAVNVDARESGLEQMSEDEFRGMVRTETAGPTAASALQARQTEAAQNFWRYGLILMLIALAAESVVGKPT